MSEKEKLKLYSKEKLIDIIEKLSVEYAIKNQQYEYLRHNNLQEENERLNNIINDKKEREDIVIRLLHKLFGTDDYEINCIIGIINGQRQIKFNNEILDILKGEDNDR